MKLERWWLALLTIAWLVSAAFAVAGAQEEVMVVGKKSTITFPIQTKIGDLVLPPGRYRLQHGGEGAEHFVEFTPIDKTDSWMDKEYGHATGKASRATRRLEPLKEKVSQTTVAWVTEGDFNRVTKIKVRGENAVHLF